MTYLQAIILGLIQGISELFPVSSLGHSVILPTLFGWHNLVAVQSQTESFFLAFLVGLHVATALALLWFYRAEWVRIIGGFLRWLSQPKTIDSDGRLAWLLIIATIPAGLAGLLFEHAFRVVFAKPLAAAIFLLINGFILFYGDRLRRQAEHRTDFSLAKTATNLGRLSFLNAFVIGLLQTFALLAGISRSGITMVAGLGRGLDYEDSARFSFLLATPIILAAGVYKLPDLLGPNGAGVRGQVLAGSLAAGIAAYLSVRFLDRYFRSGRLRPFAFYCFALGLFTLVFLHQGIG